MLFSSITFLYVFLPCVIILYFAVPRQIKNYILLAASLLFYAWGEPRFVFIMLIEIISGYVFGLLIGKYCRKAPAKFFLGASLFVDLALLGYFKYANFFVDTFRQMTGMSVNALNIALPIGISFYTFQIISYTVDVYRGEVRAQKNPVILATYVAMFPQLIAGPIVRYADIEKQLINRVHSVDKMALGIRRFVIGLSKKVLIANALGELCNTFRESSDLSVAYYWLYALSFTLHIYFDFSGYSDMAIGLGHMFGFDFKENFDYPYISRSITEFWRRWHMSLGSWFRDYVYIPLGGNRVSKWKWFRNIAIVWLLTGFWHGAAWNFVIWGIFFAIFLVLEKTFYGKKIQNTKILSHIYVLFLISISFVIFNAENMGQAVTDIGGMFGGGKLPLVSKEFFYYLRSYAGILLLAIMASTPLFKNIWKSMKKKVAGTKICDGLEPVVLLVLLMLVTAYLVDGSFNPFLYFRF